MTKPHEDPFEAPELAAMHVDDEWAPTQPIDEVTDDPDADDTEKENAEDPDPDVAGGRALEQDLAMAEAELVDQGEITAADQQFDT